MGEMASKAPSLPLLEDLAGVENATTPDGSLLDWREFGRPESSRPVVSSRDFEPWPN